MKRTKPKNDTFRWHYDLPRRNLVSINCKKIPKEYSNSDLSLGTGWGIQLEVMNPADLDKLWAFFSELHKGRTAVLEIAKAFEAEWDAWPDGTASRCPTCHKKM